ncbi:uncharacterized protein LOC118511822 [Anopheles stephensi]|uniref:uncharacterized protein LOC118511822 n=1 Tax=Anopheles stephensi TaxID=30069 RepID=UPI001658A87C|nr:uncharacterized protein LOC118511822 [Anopheles stephensi]
MPGPPSYERDFPPLGGPSRNERTLPDYMDKNNDHGDMKFLVLQTTDGSLLPKNPFVIGKSLSFLAGELSEPGKVIDNGKKLLIKTRSSKQFKSLQTLSKLIDGTSVTVTPHTTLNSVQCVIFSPDLKDVSDETTLEELKDQRVISVRRFKRKVNSELVPINIFLLRINTTSIPSFIRLGALQVSTRPYYPKPMMCYNCAHYGHTKMSCKVAQACANCGTPAHGDCPVDPVCINCKGTHNAFSRSCPRYLQEEAVIKYKVDNNCSYGEARRSVSLPVTPSLVQQRITYAQQTMQDEKDILIANLQSQNQQQEELIKTLRESIDSLRKQINEQACPFYFKPAL